MYGAINTKKLTILPPSCQIEKFKNMQIDTLPTADSWYRKAPRLCPSLYQFNIDISLEMAAQSVQRNQAFCVTASDWSPIHCQPK